MAKRFLDTGFLEQKWIRRLSPERKIFLIYLMLRCDNAGIIELDYEDASFWIGKKIDSIDFLPEGYLIQIPGTGKYIIPKFIEWQYPDLSSNKHITAQVRQILDKYGLIDEEFNLRLDKLYVNVTQTLPENQVTSIGNSNGNKRGSGGKFIKPTVEEIKAYCEERGNGIDAKAFFDHYEARGWIPKGYTTQLKDWMAAVRTWERNKTNYNNNGSNKQSNQRSDKRVNDYWNNQG